MWTYSQHSGKLMAPDGSFVGIGYSGHGAGVNNPEMEAVRDVGPIPQGLYAIGVAYSDSEKGPCVMPLTPDGSTDTFGRSGFLIHGDEVGEVGKQLASEGCIILNHALREEIAASGDNSLEVIG